MHFVHLSLARAPRPSGPTQRFSGSDRLLLGCSLGLALAVLAAAVLLSWLLAYM